MTRILLIAMKEQDKLKQEIADLEQYIYSIETDAEMKWFNQAQKDLTFLKELRRRLKMWDEKKDGSQRDYAFKMVNDWIEELSIIVNSG